MVFPAVAQLVAVSMAVVIALAVAVIVMVVGHGERVGLLQRREFNGLRHGHGPSLFSKRGQDGSEAMAVDEHKIGLLQEAPLLRGQGERMGILFTGQKAMDGERRRGQGAGQVAQHPVGRQHLEIVRLGLSRAGRLQRSRATAPCGQATQQHHRQGKAGQTSNHWFCGRQTHSCAPDATIDLDSFSLST